MQLFRRFPITQQGMPFIDSLCGRKELFQRKQREKNKNQQQIYGSEHPTFVYRSEIRHWAFFWEKYHECTIVQIFARIIVIHITKQSTAYYYIIQSKQMNVLEQRTL